MCKLEGIKWVVVKSNKNVSKNLANKISKIRNASVINNVAYFYCLKDIDKLKIVELLKNYKNLKFEICEFYDKQFGLTINHWKGVNDLSFDNAVEKLPLSQKIYWYNPGSELISVTPITTKQFNSIIKINC